MNFAECCDAWRSRIVNQSQWLHFGYLSGLSDGVAHE